LCGLWYKKINMESGLILFNKPAGITSFDALRDIKRALGTGKVGHSGTLDKFASGLLIVLVGKSLRLSRWFSHCDKKYKGRIKFGVETDTLDPEGKETAEAALPLREDVERVLSQFTGNIMQTPPAFSAIHINGKRASSLARSGIQPEMKERPVNVYKLELLSWEPPYADIFVHCSSGTYIRSLARDIALAAGSRGHLVSLIRTQIAGFCLESEKLEVMSEEYKINCIDRKVISLLGMPWFDVSKQEKQDILHGKPLCLILGNKQLSISSLHTTHSTLLTLTAAVFEGEELIAVIEKEDNSWKYGCVLKER